MRELSLCIPWRSRNLSPKREACAEVYIAGSSPYLPSPKGPKYLYGTKYGFCSSNFPYSLGKYSPYGYLGPFGQEYLQTCSRSEEGYVMLGAETRNCFC